LKGHEAVPELMSKPLKHCFCHPRQANTEGGQGNFGIGS
jgi:hypothetical protein